MPWTTLLLALFSATSIAGEATGADDEVARQRLLGAFDAVFGAHPTVGVPGEKPACLTPLVQDLRDHWHLFSPAERARMTAALAPWKADLQDPPAPPPPVPGNSCFGRIGSHQISGDHFVVEYDDIGLRDDAEFFLEALEYSWEKEVDEFGWRAPIGSEGWPVLAYVAEGGGASAYTSVEYCSGYGYMPYIVAYEGSFDWSAWAEDMAAHEFNHALQFSTTYGHEFWWWEATATWIEDQVNPANNTWASYVSAYSEWPWMAMNAGSQSDYEIFYHMYGMSIFARHLDDHLGGRDFVRDTWEWVADNDYEYYDAYLPTVIEEMGEDWDEVWTDFLTANTVMEYTDGDRIQDVEIQQYVRELPADGQHEDATAPQSLGANFIRFDGDLGTTEEGLWVEFNGHDGPKWYAVLVGTEGEDHVVTKVVLDLDETGKGAGLIPFNGHPIYLVVSPWDAEAWGSRYDWTDADAWGWSWAAVVTDLPEEKKRKERGLCAALPVAGTPWTLALLAGLTLRRRRR